MIQRNEEGFVKNQEWLRWLIALLFLGSKTRVTYAAIQQAPDWVVTPTQVWMLDLMVDHGDVAERRCWAITWRNCWINAKRVCALRNGGDKWSC